jgi:uncharacterized protein (UPF0248 family)
VRKGKVRAILESMIWDARNRREDYRIIFRDRGMPNDVSEVRGDEIEVRSDRIVLRDGREIPHHRIIAIWRGNELLYIVHER